MVGLAFSSLWCLFLRGNEKMKSEFLTKLEVEKLKGNNWQVLSALKFQSRKLNKVVEVPAGFVTDFASVPRLPIVYLLAGDTAHEAAVVHDYLYQMHLVGKAKADAVFLEAMRASGVPKFRRWLMYMGVKVGGFSAYSSGPDRFKVLNKKV